MPCRELSIGLTIDSRMILTSTSSTSFLRWQCALIFHVLPWNSEVQHPLIYVWHQRLLIWWSQHLYCYWQNMKRWLTAWANLFGWGWWWTHTLTITRIPYSSTQKKKRRDFTENWLPINRTNIHQSGSIIIRISATAAFGNASNNLEERRVLVRTCPWCYEYYRWFDNGYSGNISQILRRCCNGCTSNSAPATQMNRAHQHTHQKVHQLTHLRCQHTSTSTSNSSFVQWWSCPQCHEGNTEGLQWILSHNHRSDITIYRI